jgi:hypothetical protein
MAEKRNWWLKLIYNNYSSEEKTYYEFGSEEEFIRNSSLTERDRKWEREYINHNGFSPFSRIILELSPDGNVKRREDLEKKMFEI